MGKIIKPVVLVLLGVLAGVFGTNLWAQHAAGMHESGHSNSGHQGAGHQGENHQNPGHAAAGSMPVEAGEAAFASVSEIVALLRADPDTDWGSVDIGVLRDHLVDMHRLMMDARITQTDTDTGVSLSVSGTPDALAAATRMLPAHSRMLEGANGWGASVAEDGDGLIWTVTGDSAADVTELQGLGFYGILATGAHHQPHHLAVASGRPMH